MLVLDGRENRVHLTIRVQSHCITEFISDDEKIHAIPNVFEYILNP